MSLHGPLLPDSDFKLGNHKHRLRPRSNVTSFVFLTPSHRRQENSCLFQTVFSSRLGTFFMEALHARLRVTIHHTSGYSISLIHLVERRGFRNVVTNVHCAWESWHSVHHEEATWAAQPGGRSPGTWQHRWASNGSGMGLGFRARITPCGRPSGKSWTGTKTETWRGVGGGGRKGATGVV